MTRRSTILAAVVLAASAACSEDPTAAPAAASAPRPAVVAGDVPAYSVADLGTLGGSFSIAFGVNAAGHVAGGANTADESSHFFLWRDGAMTDAGSLGGNANAAINAADELAGLSETASPDPNGEDFCGFGTHRTCLAAVWRKGVMTALPTLGGHNGQGANVNDRGQIVGTAETNVRDATCAAGTPSQLYRYEAAVWAPGGKVQALAPLPGDQVGIGIGLNEHEQYVGSSGSCAATTLVGRVAGPHAVLWDHGTPIALDAGTHNTISVAASINGRGQVAGGSGTTTLHSFVWTRQDGKRDIGTVEGDLGSFATGINARGDVVGISCINDSLCDTTNPALLSRAYLWHAGVMRDVNALVVAGAPMILLTAFGINERGQIVGLGLNLEDFQPHAYLATPMRGNAARLAAGISRSPTLSARNVPAAAAWPQVSRGPRGRVNRIFP